MPIQRRLPKRGFTNIFRVNYNIINLKDLNKVKSNDPITLDLLLEKKIVKRKRPIKILGEGELTKPVIIHAKKFSKSAMKKIEEAGGKAVVV